MLLFTDLPLAADFRFRGDDLTEGLLSEATCLLTASEM